MNCRDFHFPVSLLQRSEKYMADKHNTTYDRELQTVRQIAEDILEYRTIDTPRAYLRVESRIQKQAWRERFMRGTNRIAAILLLPLLVSSITLSYLYIRQGQELAKVDYQETTAAPGTVVRLELSDRSIVWLNAGSTLAYPSRFKGDNRQVVLSGEGYFEVESDLEHPFYVSTRTGTKVMAYGTKFNVNAYEGEPTIEAVLERGKIEVTHDNERVQLEPGSQATLDRQTGKLHVSSVNLDEKTGWRTGRLVFRNTPLETVLDKLSRRYNVDIQLHNESRKEYRYRATFTSETIEQILDYLRLTAPIEWSMTNPRQNGDGSLERKRIDVYINDKRHKTNVSH